MTPAIEVLWKQALKTFEGRRSVGFKLCQKNFDELWNLMNNIKAEDVNLNKQILDFVKVQSRPMCVIEIFENRDLTMSIFILKHGVTMPMHDHPGMHGFLKVISGTVQMNSYTLKTNDDRITKPNKVVTAVRHQPISLNSNSPACILTPWEKNLHEISCIEGPAAFLDILSPPYQQDASGKGPRPCTFFTTINSKSCTESPDVIEEVKLLVIKSPAFYSISLQYMGPPII